MTETCLHENEILDYVGGRLAGATLEAAEVHLDDCTRCRALVLEILAQPNSEPTLSNIDRYVVIRPLATGASGIVYAAYDPKLDRKLAIKLLFSNELMITREQLLAAKNRLQREAQAMAKIAHPNVVTIYDVGVFDDRLFIAMALLDGVSLRHWLSTPRSWREVVGVFSAAGRGLQAAHDAGLLHRDFKPENVVVNPAGDVWLTDFGLAKAARGSDNGGDVEAVNSDARPAPKNWTASLGTPAYMAPEQLRNEPLDARADLFSFCVALHEALYGQRPFAGTSEVERRETTRATPLPLEVKGRRQVPGWLRRIVLSGLHSDPERRPPSMQQLLAEIAKHTRPKSRALISSLAVAAAVALLCFGYQQQQRCQGADALLRTVWDQSQRDAVAAKLVDHSRGAEAMKLFESTVDIFGDRFRAAYRSSCEAAARKEIPAERYDLQTQCFRYELWQIQAETDLVLRSNEKTDIASLAARIPVPGDCLRTAALVPLPVDRQSQASIDAMMQQLANAKTLDDAGRKEDARAVLTPLLASALALNYPPLIAKVHYQLAVTFMLGDAPEALRLLRSVSLEADRANDDRTRALVAIKSADAEAYLGELAKADASLQDAKAVIDRLGDELELLASLETVAAKISQRREAFAEASHHAQLALEYERRRPATALATEAPLLVSLCRMQSDENAGEVAVKTCSEAQSAVESLYGPDHPRAAMVNNALGVALYAMGRKNEALAAYDHALATATKVWGEDNALVAPYLVDRAEVLTALDRPSEALQDCRKAYDIFSGAGAEHQPELVAVLINEADAERALHHYRQSWRLLDDADRLLAMDEASDAGIATVKLLRAKLLVAEGKNPGQTQRLLSEAHGWFAKKPAWHQLELAEIDKLISATAFKKSP